VPAELLARAAGRCGEPFVEQLRPRHRHLIGADAVQFNRLAFLRLVPHHDVVRRHAHQTLAGQVVPAGDAERAAHSEMTSGLDVVDLLRAQLHERRHEHEIRLALLDERHDQGIRAKRRLDGKQQAATTAPRRVPHPRDHPNERRIDTRQTLFGALA
jgi:hypothetical protein